MLVAVKKPVKIRDANRSGETGHTPGRSWPFARRSGKGPAINPSLCSRVSYSGFGHQAVVLPAQSP